MEDEPLYQCLLWLHDARLICTQIKHVCLNTVPLIKATSGLWFIVWTGFYTSGKLNKCNLAELKCKYKDYTALFSKSLLVRCAVFWIPAHTSYIWKWDISLAVKETLLAWVAELFYLCLPTMPQAQHGWRLTDGRHEFPTSKTEHFAACLPQHKGTFMQAKRSAGH